MIPTEPRPVIKLSASSPTVSVPRTARRVQEISAPRMTDVTEFPRWSHSPSTMPSTLETLICTVKSLTNRGGTPMDVISKPHFSYLTTTPTTPLYPTCTDWATRLLLTPSLTTMTRPFGLTPAWRT